MEGFSVGALEFGVISAVATFLVKKLLEAKDAQIESEREEKLAYRAALFSSIKTGSRATSAADKATAVLAKEKGIEDG
jgi:hypothetical protein